ncbi:MAG: beta-eliminating lyase-related protein [Oscillospiraceae bacterium]|nr:beta-eliminating lyase-related protein [Oscillospiraceae bacterium]
MICFASDNRAPVHPKVMEALAAANIGHAPAYGEDKWTGRLNDRLNVLFGREVYPFIMFGGTGSNVAAMAHLTQGYSAAICTDVSHMNTSETGAPERMAGIKLLAVPHSDGKLTAAGVEKHARALGNEHYAQPRIVSLTQATEFGTVYTPDETRAICDTAHHYGMYVYMDGSRIANAAACLDVPIADMTVNAGVDAVCFGGTKNGMMYGECLIFFDKWVGKRFIFTRKNMAQLPSKSRYISAQFCALLEDGLWLSCARMANGSARYLAGRLGGFNDIKIVFPVQTNQIFLEMDAKLALELKKDFNFYETGGGCYRLVTSFDTGKEEADAFIQKLHSYGCR